MVDVLHLDLETFSEVDLKKCGSHVYWAHPSTKILCAAWAFNDGPVKTWDIRDEKNGSMFAHILYSSPANTLQGTEWHAWNAGGFETLGMIADGSAVDISRWRDTMIRAAYYGLPMSLDQAARALNLDVLKDMSGHRLMLKMCKPAKDGSKWHEKGPALLDKLVEYCKQDVETERAVGKYLPPLPDSEQKLWELDWSMMRRGMPIDVNEVLALEGHAQMALANLNAELRRIMGGSPSISSTAQILKWVNDVLTINNLPITLLSLDKAAVAEALSSPYLPKHVRRVLEIRQEAAKSSVAKLRSMMLTANGDNRIRGLTQFYGASRTGRWAGRLVQVQNLPRPAKGIDPDNEITAMRSISSGLYQPPLGHTVLSTISSCLRGLFTQSSGFVMGDFSQIEARVIAWLAGQKDILDVFAKGEDVYTYTAGKLGSKDRQFGKVLVLACLAEDTLVLTDKGHVPIQEVTRQHAVWDGVEWVRHQGLVYRGERETVELDGCYLTPEHEVLCGGRWLPAQAAAQDESTLSRMLETGSESLPFAGTNSETGAASASFSSRVLAALQSIGLARTRSAQGRPHAAMSARNGRQAIGSRTGGATQTCVQTTATAVGYSTACLPASIAAITPTTAVSATMARGAFTSSSLGAKTAELFSNICSRWRAGTTRRWNWTGPMSTGATNPATFSSSRAGRTSSTGAQSQTCNAASKNSKPRTRVYDLAFAGPRNRFTVCTASGFLLVHNCGFGMGGGKFLDTAATYGVTLDAVQAQNAVQMWRDANPMVVAFWKALEFGARRVLNDDVEAYHVGKITLAMGKRRLAGCLLMKLPSGRVLVYRNARLVPNEDPKWPDEIVYDGVNQTTRKWETQSTYGGKLAENATQAVARDLLAHTIAVLELYNTLTPLVTIHDEIVCETVGIPADQLSASLLHKAMTAAPPWAAGLPVAAECKAMMRYGK